MPSGTQAGSIIGWQPFSNMNTQQNHLESLIECRLLGLIFRNPASVGLGWVPRISISTNSLVIPHVAGPGPHTWKTTGLEQSGGETVENRTLPCRNVASSYQIFWSLKEKSEIWSSMCSISMSKKCAAKTNMAALVWLQGDNLGWAVQVITDSDNDRMRISQQGGTVRRLLMFWTYILCCYYNIKKVKQLVLSEVRSNSSCKQHVNVLKGGKNLKAEGSILLKREGEWWGAKTGSGREILGTGG